SSLVCFELFVRPALQKLRGIPPVGLPRIKARLMHEHQQRGERPTYWPGALQAATGDRSQGTTASVSPLKWQGSGDLRTLADADCLAYFPAGDRLFAAGDEIECLLLPAGDP